MDVKSPKIVRYFIRQRAILPFFAAILLSSCTSTVSGIDTTAASLQPQSTSAAAAGPTSNATTALSEPTLALAGTEATVTGPATAPAATLPNSSDVALNAPSSPTTVAAPAAGEFTVASAAAKPSAQQDITAAATGTEPVATAGPEALPATAAPAPVIATAQAPAGTPKLTAPEPNADQVKLASAEAKVAPAVQELKMAQPAQQFVDASPAAETVKPRKSLFASMFGDSQPKPTKIQTAPAPLPAQTQLALASPKPKSAALAAATGEIETPQLSLTNASLEEVAPHPNLDNGDLPGVRKGALFEIKRRDSLDSDADIDIGETDGGPVLLASAAGLGRLAPNGLKVQRQSVDVACLKPQLVRMLKKLEAHYGRSVMVTSGYRSPGYNRRVRGAKNSLHMYCAAADIQIDGVGKWELAKFARSMPGRGGVGTYCHTDSVHVDIGPDRDWNWRCSRRK